MRLNSRHSHEVFLMAVMIDELRRGVYREMGESWEIGAALQGCMIHWDKWRLGNMA